MRKILLATNGSQGVCALRELYALGFSNDNISVITFQSDFNKTFFEFLRFNKKEYTIITSNKQLDNYFEDKIFDILLSISFRFIFSNVVLSHIRLAAINLHPGILPDYRGSFSIPWAIINNEKTVGYTYHLMSKNVDKGRILLQEKFPIGNRTSHILHYLVFQRGISKLGDVLSTLHSTEIHDNITDNITGGKFYPNRLPFNGQIDLNWENSKIERFIRAMYFPPFKPAFIVQNGENIYFRNYNEFDDFLKTMNK